MYTRILEHRNELGVGVSISRYELSISRESIKDFEMLLPYWYTTGKSLTKDILVGVKAKKIRRKSSSDTAPDYVETHYTSALGFGLSLCKGQDGPHPWGDVILEQNINPISSGARA